MSVNGNCIYIEIEHLACSQCYELIDKCFNCGEPFKHIDFIYCGNDGSHNCEQCYEDFMPKSINEDLKK